MTPLSRNTRSDATHVLIVDDDPDIRDALSDMLGHEGNRGHAVGTGVEAIRQASQTHYEAALLDMQLPDLHGHVVMKFLMDADPKLPIIAITADDAGLLRKQMLSEGFDEVLYKPVSTSLLLQSIENLLQHSIREIA